MTAGDWDQTSNPPIRGRPTGPPQTSVHLLTRLKEIKSWKRSSLVISFVQNLVGESVLVQTLYEVNLFSYQRFSSSIIPFIQGKWSFLPLRLYFRADISLHFASPAATLWCSRSPPVHLYLTFISISAFPSIRLPFPGLGGGGSEALQPLSVSTANPVSTWII